MSNTYKRALMHCPRSEFSRETEPVRYIWKHLRGFLVRIGSHGCKRPKSPTISHIQAGEQACGVIPSNLKA